MEQNRPATLAECVAKNIPADALIRVSKEGLHISAWIKAVNRLDDITQIRSANNLPILMKALERHQGNDPAPVSTLWLWVTARVTNHANDYCGLWVWKRSNPETGKTESLVFSTNPDALNEIMIFPSLTNVKMAADFINFMPPPNCGYSIARRPANPGMGFDDWEEGLRKHCKDDYIRAQKDWTLDYYYGPLLIPTNKLAGTVKTKDDQPFIEIDKHVPNIEGIPSKKQKLKDGLKIYQKEINRALGNVKAEPLDITLGSHRQAVIGIVEEWISIKPSHRQTYREYYDAVLKCFEQLQGQCPHPNPKIGERYKGYLFRRITDEKPIGFELLELPFENNPLHNIAQSSAGLSLTDQENGVAGIQAFMLRHIASELKRMGISHYCQGGAESRNKKVWDNRKKTAGFPETISLELETIFVTASLRKWLKWKPMELNRS